MVVAALDLGASRLRAFWSVTVPLTLPGFMAGCVLVFIPSVGLFFISDLLGGAKTMLLGNLIKNELLVARNWPMGAALSVAMLLMTLGLLPCISGWPGIRNLRGCCEKTHWNKEQFPVCRAVYCYYIGADVPAHSGGCGLFL